MPVPSSIDDLSTTAASNSPAGSETPTEGDNYIRTYGAFIAALRDKLNGTSATGTINDATFSGTMAGAATWSDIQTFAAAAAFLVTPTGKVTASTYTPTVSSTTNVTSTTVRDAFYLRVGDVVVVAGQINVDPTTTSAVTSFNLSLPISSTLTASWNLCGIGSWISSGSGAVIPVGIDANVGANTAQLLFYTTTSHAVASMAYVYAYRVI